MTDFKYGLNNYPRTVSTGSNSTAASTTMNSNSTTTSIHQQQQQHHSRLKKSLSECEYYDNDNRPASCTLGLERNFNLSPSKRVRVGDRHIDEIAFIEQQQQQPGSNNNQRLYNYDTMKSQYLLQQQQKLKEYKLDPNYNESYATDTGLVETKGILKNSTRTLTPCSDSTAATAAAAATGRNSLKRNKGLSTLSLCSCDADTEVSAHIYRLNFMANWLLLWCLQRSLFRVRTHKSEGGKPPIL